MDNVLELLPLIVRERCVVLTEQEEVADPVVKVKDVVWDNASVTTIAMKETVVMLFNRQTPTLEPVLRDLVEHVPAGSLVEVTEGVLPLPLVMSQLLWLIVPLEDPFLPPVQFSLHQPL